jgi:hypothetical protein
MNANTISTGVIDVKNNEILLLSDCNLTSSTGRNMEKIMGLGTFGPHIESIESYSKSMTLNGPLLYPLNAFPFSLIYTYPTDPTAINGEDTNPQERINGEDTNPENEELNNETTGEYIYNCFDLYSWAINNNIAVNNDITIVPTHRNSIVEYLLGMYIDSIGLSFGDNVSCDISMSTRMPYQVSLYPNISYDFMNFKITNDPRITSNQYISNRLKMTYFLLQPQYFIQNDITQQFVITNCKFNIKLEYFDLKNLISQWDKPEFDLPHIDKSYPIIPRILTGITMDAEYDFLLLKMSEIHKIEVSEMQENLMARLECPANSYWYPPIDFITIYDVGENTNGYITLLMNHILSVFGHTGQIKWTIKDCNLTGITPSGIPSYHLSYGSSIIFNPLKIMQTTAFDQYVPEQQS